MSEPNNADHMNDMHKVNGIIGRLAEIKMTKKNNINTRLQCQIIAANTSMHSVFALGARLFDTRKIRSR